ncbi:MAG TPA: pitrilysin family protein [Candidatus Didemnitutus sp.]|nr:pitrilysin family protein [Candidatus Didemnitutus sp.]
MSKRFSALRALATSAVFTLGLLPGLRAEPAKVPGFSYVKSLGGIDEYRLDANGLQVLVMPDHSAPVITFQVTYRVGSRNEVTGTTGATHLLEHLMFKGSEHFNRSTHNGFDQMLDPMGATNNATTWVDRTNYFEIFGSEHLPQIVEMEADRMRGLLLHEDDRRPEMTVVRNEFERGENSPFQALIKEITAAAYVAHPYHHSTIGWRSDIEKVSIDKLREFYDTFYWPDNATVTIVGDFSPADALGLVQKYYGAIPKSPKPIPQVYTEEPEQTGPRRVTVKRAGQLGVVAIGHKTPAALHPDYPAVIVLSTILTDGKNSRLYKAITDQSLSTGVSGFPFTTRDPSLHFTFIPLAPGVEHAKVEEIAIAEIEKLKKDGVTAAEVQAAIAKNLASSAFQRDGTMAIASNINEAIAVGDWTFYYTFDEAMKKVTPADVQRVAQKYFNVDQSTTGWFIPLAAK